LNPAHDPRRTLARRILPLLDLTSLGEDDTPAQIASLAAAALAVAPPPAALCVYPEHVTTARGFVTGAGIRVATVVNFPDGGDDPERVTRETRRAISAGADEVDLVLPWRALLAQRPDVAVAVVRACRLACGPSVPLKLILETGDLRDPERIRQACRIGLEEGVDFLKTSTGKVPVNATPEAVEVMLSEIAAAGGACGLKVAGGVRTIEDAARYLDLVEARMGAAWIQSRHLRIGASALFGELRAAVADA
jgi:deoxyribose-phosphate aldolase